MKHLLGKKKKIKNTYIIRGFFFLGIFFGDVAPDM